MNASGIRENLEIAKRRIEAARKVSGVSAVTIVGITKTRTPFDVAELIISGCNDIGENRIQEWNEKLPLVKDELKKRDYDGKFASHLVGHLQSNKAKRAVLDFDTIQSLDSLDLAERVGRIAEEEGRATFQCMIQVKLGEEETKSGIEKEILIREFESFIDAKGIRIIGLMLIAPLWAVGDDARPYFSEMRELFQDFKKRQDNRFEMKYLSMGMSADFDIAVEEGANMVRIGRALFEGFHYV